MNVAQSLESLQEGASFDVVIVGAGMVGASAAIGASAMGYSVLLIDAFAFQGAASEYTPSYDARSTALSWGSRDIFQQLGVWDNVVQHACPIAQVHVSEKGRFGVTRLAAEEFSREALGYVVPNQWLGQCLLERTAQLDIPLCAPVKVSGITTENGRQSVCLVSEKSAEVKTVHARLLVIADGTCSETAELLGIGSSIEQYGQHALIANVSTELPNNGVAYERFTEQGPLALLPLTDNTSSLVWTHDSKDIDSFLGMDDATFCQNLQTAFGDRMGRFVRCGKRNVYPLRLVRANEQCRPGVLLLGNAAHSLHPVAGQGFNLALRGVASFLEMLNLAKSQHKAFEELSVLKQMCDALNEDQAATILFSDQLIKIFGNSSPLIGFIRDLGLIGLSNIPLVKSAFASRAMGLATKKKHFGRSYD